MTDEREPNEEAPAAPRDLPSPDEGNQTGGVGADPAEDDELSDEVNDAKNSTSSGAGAGSGERRPRLNPYKFGHSATPMNKPFSGRVPSFGNDAAKVGGRSFAEVFEAEQENSNSAAQPQPPQERNSVGGLARSFLNLPKKPSTTTTAAAIPATEAEVIPPVGRKLPFASDESSDKPVDADTAEDPQALAEDSAKEDVDTAAASVEDKPKSIPFARFQAKSPFGTGADAPTAAAAVASSDKGASATTASAFGASKTKVSFGASAASFSTTASLFGSSESAPTLGAGGAGGAPTFGASSIACSTAAPTFGAATPAVPTAPATFGAPKDPFSTAPASFGSSATTPQTEAASTPFASTKPTFGASGSAFAISAPTFGTAPTDTAGFVAPSTMAKGFGSASFGASGSAPTFGAASTAVFGFGTSGSAFGATSTATGFGTSGWGFAAASTATFGFGASSSALGSASTVGTGFGTSGSAFVAASTGNIGFGSAPTFGASSSGFGAGTKPLFGSDAGMDAREEAPNVPKLFEKPTTGTFGSFADETKAKVSTPLFGLGVLPAKNKQAKFTQRPSFQTALSPTANTFVPGATVHKKFHAESQEEKEVEKKVSEGSEKKEDNVLMGDATKSKESGKDENEAEDDSMEVERSDESEKEPVGTPVPTGDPVEEQKAKILRPVVRDADSKRPEITKVWSHAFYSCKVHRGVPVGAKFRGEPVEGTFNVELYGSARDEALVGVDRVDGPGNEAVPFVHWKLDGLKIGSLKKNKTVCTITRIGVSAGNLSKLYVHFTSEQDCTLFNSIITQPNHPARATQPPPPPRTTAAPATMPSKPLKAKENPSKPSAGSASAADPSTQLAEKTQAVIDKKNSLIQQKLDMAKRKKLMKEKLLATLPPKPTTDNGTAAPAPLDDKTESKKEEKPIVKPAPAPAPTTVAAEKPTRARVSGSKRTAPETTAPLPKKAKAEDVEITKEGGTIPVSNVELKKEPVPAPAPVSASVAARAQQSLLTSKEVAALTCELNALRKSLSSARRDLDSTQRKLAQRDSTLDSLRQSGAALKHLAEKLSDACKPPALAVDLEDERLNQVRPDSPEHFKLRLNTFTRTRWTAYSVRELSPKECAAYGWYCADVDTLHAAAGAQVKLDTSALHNPKTMNAEINRVRAQLAGRAHPPLAGWKGKRCPDAVVNPTGAVKMNID